MKFTKKPVTIEAEQLTEENKDRAFNFANTNGNCIPSWEDNGDHSIQIQTLEGVMTAKLGDWIIKGHH